MLRRPLVLVVEDHPDMQSLIAEHFAQHGWDVARALDGETALRIARERLPELVCLDLNLPSISGYDVCEEIRTDPRLEGVIVVMTSARSGIDVRAHSLEAGADEYLQKPYDLDDLTSVVEQLCRQRAEQ
ncbi:MAG TPA: response regulator [Polyangiaceae bacterium]